jgi:hypothetical protein
VIRICSAMAIASSYGEFCPTPYLIPATVEERYSRYPFPSGDEASDFDITKYGARRLRVDNTFGSTDSRDEVKVTLYCRRIGGIELERT